jgi:8-oxo-dGTP diphosphatase
VSDRFNNAVIEGAGGIVEHRDADGVRIAVIYRRRYAPEWALPKGKREPNESWQDAARREVEEETGLKATIVGIVGSTFYLAGDSPKLVAYWRMRVDGPLPLFVPNEEVTALEWLPPDEAAARLTHADQADIVRKGFREAIDCRPDRRSWLDRKFTPILHRRRLRRVVSEIRTYREELGAQEQLPKTIDILAKAEEAVLNGEIDCGWRYLQVARRLELARQNPEDIKAAAMALSTEADHKLDGWRKAAVNKLLTGVAGSCANDPSPESSRARVCQAAAIRDEHFNNEAYKDSLNRTKAAWLACSLLLALVALLVIAYLGLLGALVNSTPGDGMLPALLSLAILGWLGATISAITKLPTPSVSSRIPELVTSGRIIMLRLMMGPAFAIIAFFVTQSALAKQIIALDVGKGYIILVVALAAGFSERLVLRVFRAIDKPESQ